MARSTKAEYVDMYIVYCSSLGNARAASREYQCRCPASQQICVCNITPQSEENRSIHAGRTQCAEWRGIVVGLYTKIHWVAHVSPGTKRTLSECSLAYTSWGAVPSFPYRTLYKGHSQGTILFTSTPVDNQYTKNVQEPDFYVVYWTDEAKLIKSKVNVHNRHE
jgi:hypothetical protein